MNYEDLYRTLSEKEKALKDTVNAVLRLQKLIVKDTESGNLAELNKSIALLNDAANAIQVCAGEMENAAAAFDVNEYFANGDFARQLLEICGARGIDVKGEKGVYEMFPYKVRILGDREHAAEVYINRKKIPSFRPSAVADAVKQGQDKLNRAGFNDKAFLAELADAYETSCLKSNTAPGATVLLTKLYKIMTPMARARKEYDMQAFAFDLARLYEKGPDSWIDKNGRVYVFGTSRDGKNGIRVLSSTGVESYITTIRQLSAGE